MTDLWDDITAYLAEGYLAAGLSECEIDLMAVNT